MKKKILNSVQHPSEIYNILITVTSKKNILGDGDYILRVFETYSFLKTCYMLSETDVRTVFKF